MIHFEPSLFILWRKRTVFRLFLNAIPSVIQIFGSRNVKVTGSLI